MGGTLTFLTPGIWLPHCENRGREPLPLAKMTLTGKTVLCLQSQALHTHCKENKQ